MAKLEVPNHWSSQNLNFLPFPTFHWYPTFAALAAQRTPFQKGEAPAGEQEKILGSLTLYLWSIICFQSLLSFK
jgi:hypothetical protein